VSINAIVIVVVIIIIILLLTIIIIIITTTKITIIVVSINTMVNINYVVTQAISRMTSEPLYSILRNISMIEHL
jgi:hypothetical protein